VKLTYDGLTLQLGQPFVSNKGSVTRVHQVLVRLQWEGRIGLGTAVFAREYGMLADTVAPALDACAELLSGASPFHLEQVLDRLEAAVPGQSTAVAAVDMALHDLLGQVAGLPLRRLWGLGGLALGPTALSLGALPEGEVVERARQLARWPILKLKMTAATDMHSVGRLREVYDGRIWIDGNGAWDIGEAIAAAEAFHRYGVELLEQPIRAGTPDMLRLVRERSPLPIVADEDCLGPQDVLRLQACADVINIKLLKCGGLRRALEMIRLARRLGLGVMLGCKTESVLGITAIAQLAGLADYLDLDGHLDLLDDPYAGIGVDCGRITLPEAPGLGVTPRQRGAG
jgi:L-alanine-DL-glutamate epimerase-like enolase superfamily enzyme